MYNSNNNSLSGNSDNESEKMSSRGDAGSHLSESPDEVKEEIVTTESCLRFTSLNSSCDSLSKSSGLAAVQINSKSLYVKPAVDNKLCTDVKHEVDAFTDISAVFETDRATDNPNTQNLKQRSSVNSKCPLPQSFYCGETDTKHTKPLTSKSPGKKIKFSFKNFSRKNFTQKEEFIPKKELTDQLLKFHVRSMSKSVTLNNTGQSFWDVVTSAHDSLSPSDAPTDLGVKTNSLTEKVMTTKNGGAINAYGEMPELSCRSDMKLEHKVINTTNGKFKKGAINGVFKEINDKAIDLVNDTDGNEGIDLQSDRPVLKNRVMEIKSSETSVEDLDEWVRKLTEPNGAIASESQVKSDISVQIEQLDRNVKKSTQNISHSHSKNESKLCLSNSIKDSDSRNNCDLEKDLKVGEFKKSSMTSFRRTSVNSKTTSLKRKSSQHKSTSDVADVYNFNGDKHSEVDDLHFDFENLDKYVLQKRQKSVRGELVSTMRKETGDEYQCDIPKEKDFTETMTVSYVCHLGNSAKNIKAESEVNLLQMPKYSIANCKNTEMDKYLSIGKESFDKNDTRLNYKCHNEVDTSSLRGKTYFEGNINYKPQNVTDKSGFSEKCTPCENKSRDFVEVKRTSNTKKHPSSGDDVEFDDKGNEVDTDISDYPEREFGALRDEGCYEREKHVVDLIGADSALFDQKYTGVHTDGANHAVADSRTNTLHAFCADMKVEQPGASNSKSCDLETFAFKDMKTNSCAFVKSEVYESVKHDYASRCFRRPGHCLFIHPEMFGVNCTKDQMFDLSRNVTGKSAILVGHNFRNIAEKLEENDSSATSKIENLDSFCGKSDIRGENKDNVLIKIKTEKGKNSKCSSIDITLATGSGKITTSQDKHDCKDTDNIGDSEVNMMLKEKKKNNTLLEIEKCSQDDDVASCSHNLGLEPSGNISLQDSAINKNTNRMSSWKTPYVRNDKKECFERKRKISDENNSENISGKVLRIKLKKMNSQDPCISSSNGSQACPVVGNHLGIQVVTTGRSGDEIGKPTVVILPQHLAKGSVIETSNLSVKPLQLTNLNQSQASEKNNLVNESFLSSVRMSETPSRTQSTPQLTVPAQKACRSLSVGNLSKEGPQKCGAIGRGGGRRNSDQQIGHAAQKCSTGNKLSPVHLAGQLKVSPDEQSPRVNNKIALANCNHAMPSAGADRLKNASARQKKSEATSKVEKCGVVGTQLIRNPQSVTSTNLVACTKTIMSSKPILSTNAGTNLKPLKVTGSKNTKCITSNVTMVTRLPITSHQTETDDPIDDDLCLNSDQFLSGLKMPIAELQETPSINYTPPTSVNSNLRKLSKSSISQNHVTAASTPDWLIGQHRTPTDHSLNDSLSNIYGSGSSEQAIKPNPSDGDQETSLNQLTYFHLHPVKYILQLRSEDLSHVYSEEDIPMSSHQQVNSLKNYPLTEEIRIPHELNKTFPEIHVRNINSALGNQRLRYDFSDEQKSSDNTFVISDTINDSQELATKTFETRVSNQALKDNIAKHEACKETDNVKPVYTSDNNNMLADEVPQKGSRSGSVLKSELMSERSRINPDSHALHLDKSDIFHDVYSFGSSHDIEECSAYTNNKEGIPEEGSGVHESLGKFSHDTPQVMPNTNGPNENSACETNTHDPDNILLTDDCTTNIQNNQDDLEIVTENDWNQVLKNFILQNLSDSACERVESGTFVPSVEALLEEQLAEQCLNRNINRLRRKSNPKCNSTGSSDEDSLDEELEEILYNKEAENKDGLIPSPRFSAK